MLICPNRDPVELPLSHRVSDGLNFIPRIFM
ncbi:hypothetical protein TSAR_007145 [Trichomalopsis sarcophagae]|uniref:Uncharacterized protein n=1 Tax=Trichomalopsis sarcophagae TaxID=543379 RepID=A0A232FFZ0_9HYME|nr:hypothetical protein TSAR_007145 [Trichomalopsis sarcophagae]